MEMLNLNEVLHLTPSSQDASSVNCCYRKNDEIPQNFRSVECEVKPFNSFWMEPSRSEELPLCEFEYELNNQKQQEFTVFNSNDQCNGANFEQRDELDEYISGYQENQGILENQGSNVLDINCSNIVSSEALPLTEEVSNYQQSSMSETYKGKEEYTSSHDAFPNKESLQVVAHPFFPHQYKSSLCDLRSDPVQVPQFPGYNLNPISMPNYSSTMPGDRCYFPNPTDNSSIKFHIRTITHCEVECPTPGKYPMTNQSWQGFENGVNKEPVQMNINESQRVSNHTKPINDSFTNSFPRADLPHVLVQEQRQTSILIGYPVASTLNNNVRDNHLEVAQPSIHEGGCNDDRNSDGNEQKRVYPYEEQNEFHSGDGQTSPLNPVPKFAPINTNESRNELSSQSFTGHPTSSPWYSCKQNHNSSPMPNSAPIYVSSASENLHPNFKFCSSNHPPVVDETCLPPFPINYWRYNNQTSPSRKEKRQNKKRPVYSNKITTKKLQCTMDGCCKKFSKEKELKVHVNKHHLQMTKPYFCSYCSKNFKRPDQLKRHEKIHTGEKPHQCAICGRQFARTDHRNTHYKKHSNGFDKFAAKTLNKARFYNEDEIEVSTKSKVLPEQNLDDESKHLKEDAFYFPMKLNHVSGMNGWNPTPYFFPPAPIYDGQIQSQSSVTNL